MRSFFGFFKLPLQIMIGGYAAFMFAAITVAVGDDYSEGNDDFFSCGDSEIEVSI